MPVARNMKELEKMLITECKRRIENIMKDYSGRWYERHKNMSQFLSINEFWDLVKKSSKIEVDPCSGREVKNVTIKFMVSNDASYPSELEENDRNVFEDLWKDFLEEYEPYMKQQKIEL